MKIVGSWSVDNVGRLVTLLLKKGANFGIPHLPIQCISIECHHSYPPPPYGGVCLNEYKVSITGNRYMIHHALNLPQEYLQLLGK